ncbi:hypothetical protein vseg_019594 [Gypsophila vaccaria]
MNTNCVKNCIIDAETPIKVNFFSIYEWPHSDAEFLKEIAKKNDGKDYTISIPSLSPSSSYHETFAYRQRYLRSYTFSKKEESAAEKTRNWFRVRFFVEKEPKVVTLNKKSNKDRQVKRIIWSGLLEFKLRIFFSCLVKVHDSNKS